MCLPVRVGCTYLSKFHALTCERELPGAGVKKDGLAGIEHLDGHVLVVPGQADQYDGQQEEEQDEDMDAVLFDQFLPRHFHLRIGIRGQGR